MCGRYYISDEEEIIEMQEIIREVNDRFKDNPEKAVRKTGEIFPTDIIPILTADGHSRRADLMTWGFPRWDGGGVIINARAETAAEKAMFRPCVESRRCLVPSTGYFEWKQEAEKKKKDKYMIRLQDNPMLYMAGLYNSYLDKKGNPYRGFVILTTTANQTAAAIHNRMPMILTGNKRDAWLYDERLARALLEEDCDAPVQTFAL